MKPRSYSAAGQPGFYTHAEGPLRAVLQRMDAENGRRAAGGAQGRAGGA